MRTTNLYFKRGLWVIVLVMLLPWGINAQPDTISFLHITDTHIIFNLDFYHPGIADDRRHYSQGIEPFKDFLATSSEKMNYDFIALTGDIIDFFEAETSDGTMLDFQSDQVSRLIDESHVPVFAVLGNHDIAAYSWQENDRGSSQKIVGRARATWIRDINFFKEGTYYRRIFHVGGKTYRMIFLDNAYNNFPPEENVKIPYIDKPQLHWLEHQIRQSEDDTEIIFMHLPVVPANSPAEPSCDLYSVLAKYPSPKMILAGHNHKNAIRDFYSPQNNRITQVQTDAFGVSPDNWRLIRLTENKILVSFPGTPDTEIEIIID